MTDFARMIDGAWSLVDEAFIAGEGDDAIQYPAGWLDGADDAQRAAVGAVAIVDEPDPATPISGREIVDVGGVPHRRAIAVALEQLRADRLAALAATRWTQSQTVIWNGRTAPADDVTTGRIVAALMRAQLAGGAGFPIRWKLGETDFVDLSVADLTAYGMAIGAHLQACFDREAMLAGSIAAAADVASLVTIDIATGWPD